MRQSGEIVSDVSTMASWESLALFPALSPARYVLVLEESASLELLHAIVAAVVEFCPSAVVMPLVSP